MIGDYLDDFTIRAAANPCQDAMEKHFECLTIVKKINLHFNIKYRLFMR
jgi:hypothetical protein